MLHLPRIVLSRGRRTLPGDQMDERLGMLWRSYRAPFSRLPKEARPRRLD